MVSCIVSLFHDGEMALPTHRVLPLILFISAVFALCVCQVPPFNVPSDRCVAPTLDYSAVTTPGAEGFVIIYSMSPFTSSCSGRVVGYWFCYQNPSSTTGERVNISTVLLLEDMGTDYTIVRRFNVEALPGGDCLSGGQCCVSRNRSAENQFGANSSYHYGVVDLPGSPNMRQTHISVGHHGYLLARDVYTQSGGTLRTSGNPTLQPLRLFQFIIDNSTSDTTTPTISTGAPPPTDTPPTPRIATSLPSTLTTPTSDTDETSSTPTPPSSLSTSSTTSTPPQPLQTPLLAGVGAALGVLLVMVVVIIMVIIIIVVVMRRRHKGFALQQSAEGPVFMSTMYSGSTELNTSASHKTELEHFEMNTNDAYGTNTAEIATTGNVAYVTTGDTIPATQNVAYGQVPPGTDDCYDYVV